MTAAGFSSTRGAGADRGNDAGVLLEHLFRHQAGRVVAHLARVLGPARLDLAEESMQEAMLRALQVWPYQGVPEKPGAWLFRVAHNAAIDALRRGRFLEQNTGAVVAELTRATSIVSGRSRFRRAAPRRRAAHDLHVLPSGNPARCAGGAEPEDGGRLQRARNRPCVSGGRRRHRAAAGARQAPDPRPARHARHAGRADLDARLDSALEAIYFIFNEGYAAHEGEDLIRQDLCFEALRLGRLLAASSLAAPRVHALVAVMALQAARLPARIDEAGDLILLEDQDRARWDQRLIALGFHHFDLSMAGDQVSEYHVQAAIAAISPRAAICDPSIGRRSWNCTINCWRSAELRRWSP